MDHFLGGGPGRCKTLEDSRSQAGGHHADSDNWAGRRRQGPRPKAPSSVLGIALDGDYPVQLHSRADGPTRLAKAPGRAECIGTSPCTIPLNFLIVRRAGANTVITAHRAQAPS